MTGVILAFKKPFRKPQGGSPAADLRELVGVYEQLIAVLRESDDASLDILTDSLVGQLVRARELLLGAADEANLRAMAMEMRACLHEFPRILRSLLPGLGPRLGESIERRLGIQFVNY